MQVRPKHSKITCDGGLNLPRNMAEKGCRFQGREFYGISRQAKNLIRTNYTKLCPITHDLMPALITMDYFTSQFCAGGKFTSPPQ